MKSSGAIKDKQIRLLQAAVLTLALFLAIPATFASTSSATGVSIADLVGTPQTFNGKQVSLSGFLAVEQVFLKPTNFYLRDEAGNMIGLELSGYADQVQAAKYAGTMVAVSGIYDADKKELKVDSLTQVDSLAVPGAAPASSMVVGPQNTLVLMAYFNNRNPNVVQGDVYRTVFNDVNAYYMEASYDLVYITGSWNGWVGLSQPVSYYGYSNPSWYFIRDVVAKVDPYVNFAGYTRLLFVNAGPNEETSGNVLDIWSARWSGLSIPTNDGVTITHGAIVPDKEAGAYGTLGVTMHEYGHELGMPDLYGYTGGVGTWDGMGDGVWNNYGNTPASFTSYIRLLQGWIPSSRVRYIGTGIAELLMLDPLEDPTGTIQVIRTSGSSYWLIEARRKQGFDAYIPAERVLVLYYDATTSRLYLRAQLDVGQFFSWGDLQVMVTKADIDNWAYQVSVSIKPWSADMRLTNNAAASNTNWKGGAVASAGSYIYTVWDDTRDGNWEIYLKRSSNYGASWYPDTRLTIDGANSWYPTVAAYGSYVYVTWEDSRDGNWEIYLLRSENYGASWYAPIRLTTNAAESSYPSVAAYYRNVHVAWHDYRDGNWEIYYARSLDNGLNWGPNVRLTNQAAVSSSAKVAAYMTNIYLVWEDNRNGNYDIFLTRSTNNGGTWLAPQQLTTNTLNQAGANLAAYGKNVHVAWTDYRYGAGEIYYRRSTNYGVGFLPEVRMSIATSTASEQPSIVARGRTVSLVWADARTGKWQIYYRDSPDNGAHWTGEKMLTASTVYAYWPSISMSSDNVYVVWTDGRNGNQEIYFKRRL